MNQPGEGQPQAAPQGSEHQLPADQGCDDQPLAGPSCADQFSNVGEVMLRAEEAVADGEQAAVEDAARSGTASAKVSAALRVIHGTPDVNNEFPYVVSLETYRQLNINWKIYRVCSGSLVTANWVLSAAHCLVPAVQVIRYGDMTVERNATDSINQVIKMFPHPNYKIMLTPPVMLVNDIGLALVEKVPVSPGKLSAVDYKGLIGFEVRYAGFGLTHEKEHMYNKQNMEKDNMKPLQVGMGVVIICPTIDYTWNPGVCVAPKCSNKHHQPLPGDSGGPLFFDGKIVAVASGDFGSSITIHTPVSPYLIWINDVITKESHHVRINS
ncbi:mast cell protease 1A-like [Ostrinia furnacalis]|uniref:mast cell protease 1A-like n=1 Tax=Ostrinia furnacalis TaxID=93504 RepID=UPI00103C8C6D|nr:mast cell protease 1A-like [Ostrinia furnacalis]